VRVMGSIRETEMKAQEVLQKVGSRLEIPETQMWQVVGDRVMLINAPQPPVASPQPVPSPEE